MKDLVAHLTGWQSRLNTNIQAALRNEPEPPPLWPTQLQTEDEINAWIYGSNHTRSAQEVLEESNREFQRLFAIMNELPDDIRVETIVFSGKTFYVMWIGDKHFAPGEFFYHFRDDHEADVHAWLVCNEHL